MGCLSLPFQRHQGKEPLSSEPRLFSSLCVPQSLQLLPFTSVARLCLFGLWFTLTPDSFFMPLIWNTDAIWRPQRTSVMPSRAFHAKFTHIQKMPKNAFKKKTYFKYWAVYVNVAFRGFISPFVCMWNRKLSFTTSPMFVWKLPFSLFW